MDTLDDDLQPGHPIVSDAALKLLKGSSVWKRIAAVIAVIAGGAGLLIFMIAFRHMYRTPDKLVCALILVVSAMAIVLGVHVFRMAVAVGRLQAKASSSALEHYSSMYSVFWKMIGITAVACLLICSWLAWYIFFPATYF
jgi:heme/copper-type cytochrome/quinol oxidase subunit 2